MRSPRASQAIGSTKNGAIMVIDAALASGMKVIDRKLEALEMNSISERRSWVPGRRVRSIWVPNLGTKTISM